MDARLLLCHQLMEEFQAEWGKEAMDVKIRAELKRRPNNYVKNPHSYFPVCKQTALESLVKELKAQLKDL